MQPILFNVPAFDSTLDYTFSFSYSGNQPMKNRLIVRDNATETILYDQTIVTMQLKHTLPANSLTNRTALYSAQIQTLDSGDTPSDLSEKILFRCYENPIWQFSNVVNNQIIHNSSVSPLVTYSQAQGEALQSYQILLYDTDHAQLSTTGTVYYVSGDISHSFYGLLDNSQHYLRATGQTVNGMSLDTGYISISVEYSSSLVYSIVSAENNEAQGYVKVSNNIVSIAGETNLNPVVYDNGKIDLTHFDAFVKFASAYEINGDFTLQIDGMNFTNYSTILELSHPSNGVFIELRYKNEILHGQTTEKSYVILRSINNGITYTTMSNLIDTPLETDIINIFIRRKQIYYELKIANITT